MSAHAFVHCLIGQAIGFLISTTERMANLKAFEVAGKATGLLPHGSQNRAGNFVLALHLLDHQFGIGYGPEFSRAMFFCPGEDSQ